ncbi:hypothetical protein Trisim1_002988 [Trichoderma cf. simile WF8]
MEDYCSIVAFMSCQWFEALCSILPTYTNISREPKVEASPGKSQILREFYQVTVPYFRNHHLRRIPTSACACRLPAPLNWRLGSGRTHDASSNIRG